MPSAGIEPATYRSSVWLTGLPNEAQNELVSKNENNQNFSKHAEFPIYKDGKELKGIPGCTPAEWFVGHEKEFDEWHNRGKRSRDKNTQGYINAIKKMNYILIPDDWIGRRVTSTEKNAFDLVFSFFNSIHHTGMRFNGYDRIDWSEARKETISNKGTRIKKVIKDATIEEVNMSA